MGRSKRSFFLELLLLEHISDDLGNQQLILLLLVSLLLQRWPHHEAALSRKRSVSTLWTDAHVFNSSIQIIRSSRCEEVSGHSTKIEHV